MRTHILRVGLCVPCTFQRSVARPRIQAKQHLLVWHADTGPVQQQPTQSLVQLTKRIVWIGGARTGAADRSRSRFVPVCVVRLRSSSPSLCPLLRGQWSGIESRSAAQILRAVFHVSRFTVSDAQPREGTWDDRALIPGFHLCSVHLAPPSSSR